MAAHPERHPDGQTIEHRRRRDYSASTPTRVRTPTREPTDGHREWDRRRRHHPGPNSLVFVRHGGSRRAERPARSPNLSHGYRRASTVGFAHRSAPSETRLEWNAASARHCRRNALPPPPEEHGAGHGGSVRRSCRCRPQPRNVRVVIVRPTPFVPPLRRTFSDIFVTVCKRLWAVSAADPGHGTSNGRTPGIDGCTRTVGPPGRRNGPGNRWYAQTCWAPPVTAWRGHRSPAGVIGTAR